MRPERMTEHFSIPLTPTDKARLEAVASAWGRPKTELAREVLMAWVNDKEGPEPKRAVV